MELTYPLEIWQVLWQHCCRGMYKSLEWPANPKPPPQCFKALTHLTIRCLCHIEACLWVPLKSPKSHQLLNIIQIKPQGSLCQWLSLEKLIHSSKCLNRYVYWKQWGIQGSAITMQNLRSSHLSWWHHQIETFSVLQRPVMWSFVFFDLSLNKQLSKQSWGWWFEMPSHPLWHHCQVWI